MGIVVSKCRYPVAQINDYGTNLVEVGGEKLHFRACEQNSIESTVPCADDKPDPSNLASRGIRNLRTDISSSSSSESDCSYKITTIKNTGGMSPSDSESFMMSTCRDNQTIDDFGDESVINWLADTDTSNGLETFDGKMAQSTCLDRDESFDGQKLYSLDPFALPGSPNHLSFATSSDSTPHPSNAMQPISLTHRSFFAPGKLIYGNNNSEECKISTKGTSPFGEHTVVENSRVESHHAALPNNRPAATSGDWLTNRFVVNDYLVLSSIGRGAFAEVRLCKHKRTNELFAMKIMNRKMIQSKMVNFRNEVEIMKKLNHPNVIRLYEVLDDPKVNKVYMVLEYLKRGDLSKAFGSQFNKRQCINDKQLWDISKQMMHGLWYLHSNDILHNDLKPSNILVSETGIVKICDFGISGQGRVRLDTAGTPSFMAPEVVSGVAHDGRLADVYALGATMYCVRFGRPPFIGIGANNNQRLMDLYDRIQNEELSFPVPSDIGLKDLISALMHKDPLRRLKLADAMKHHWIQTGPESGLSCVKVQNNVLQDG